MQAKANRSHLVNSITMMLEVIGERLACRFLESFAADGQRLWGATLADFLPERSINWPCWPEIESISNSIPVSTLTAPDASPESFTALLYRRIEQMALDDESCGEVLTFFRGYCRAFFDRRVAPAIRSSAMALKGYEQSSDAPEDPIRELMNFNDLLGILLECNNPGPADVCCSPSADLWELDNLIPDLVKLIEAMDVEERIQPELLLGRFCSDRCVLRRKRLSYAVGLDLRTVEVLMIILSDLRRR